MCKTRMEKRESVFQSLSNQVGLPYSTTPIYGYKLRTTRIKRILYSLDLFFPTYKHKSPPFLWRNYIKIHCAKSALKPVSATYLHNRHAMAYHFNLHSRSPPPSPSALHSPTEAASRSRSGPSGSPRGCSCPSPRGIAVRRGAANSPHLCSKAKRQGVNTGPAGRTSMPDMEPNLAGS